MPNRPSSFPAQGASREPQGHSFSLKTGALASLVKQPIQCMPSPAFSRRVVAQGFGRRAFRGALAWPCEAVAAFGAARTELVLLLCCWRAGCAAQAFSCQRRAPAVARRPGEVLEAARGHLGLSRLRAGLDQLDGLRAHVRVEAASGSPAHCSRKRPEARSASQLQHASAFPMTVIDRKPY
jgi:hypothetical protein